MFTSVSSGAVWRGVSPASRSTTVLLSAAVSPRSIWRIAMRRSLSSSQRLNRPDSTPTLISTAMLLISDCSTMALDSTWPMAAITRQNRKASGSSQRSRRVRRRMAVADSGCCWCCSCVASWPSHRLSTAINSASSIRPKRAWPPTARSEPACSGTSASSATGRIVTSATGSTLRSEASRSLRQYRCACASPSGRNSALAKASTITRPLSCTSAWPQAVTSGDTPAPRRCRM